MTNVLSEKEIKNLLKSRGDKMKTKSEYVAIDDKKAGLFSDDGKISMGRVLSFSATCWGLLMLSIVSIMALFKNNDVGMNVAIAWVTVIGLGFGAKVTQKLIEKKK